MIFETNIIKRLEFCAYVTCYRFIMIMWVAGMERCNVLKCLTRCYTLMDNYALTNLAHYLNMLILACIREVRGYGSFIVYDLRWQNNEQTSVINK